jgi:glycosyltransferase involved in cell wall biosynthesis
MNGKLLNILFLSPRHTGIHGGIQQYSRLFESALKDSTHVEHFSAVALGAGSFRRLRFFCRAVLSLFKKKDLAIITHLHLARIFPLLRLLGIPYWICLHGIEAWDKLSPLDRQALRHSEKILCVSRFTRMKAARLLKLPDDRFSLFPNHVEPPAHQVPDQSKARKLLGLPGFGPVLLTVSRLSAAERYKGHRQIFNILPRLIGEFPDLQYLIVGNGDDKKALDDEAARLNIRNCVHFAGALEQEKLEWAYSACDAFAMPSWGEGFGIVFLEALVRGKPVLAGNKDGSQDALMDGKLGILVDPQDPESLYAGMQRLLLACPDSNASFLKKEVLTHFGRQALQERIDALLGNRILESCAA